MTQYYARTDVSYSGGDKLFSITFPYIKREHINVYVNDELTTNYTYITSSQISISDELEAGDVISIVRTTPIDERMVVFSDTSILNKDAQNLDSTQLFDAVQEIYDNNISFKNDATTQINSIETKADTALSNSQSAVSTANSAETKADNAVSTANTASSNASTAVSTANSALSTANTALTNSETAISTANTAKNTADAADAKVDAFGESIESVIEAAEMIDELRGDMVTISGQVTDAIAAANAAQAAADALTIDDGFYDNSEQPVQSKVVKAALDNKQDTLVSGTNIKTVGNESLVGSGNIDIKTIDNQSIMGSGNVDINSIIEQNSDEKTKLWIGTYSQYQLLGNQYFGWDNTSTVFTKTQTPDETTQFYDSSADEISAVCSSFYAWKYESIIVYTKSATPAVGDFIGFSGSNTITISNDAITSIATDSISDGTITYTRDTSSDLLQTNETIYCTLHGANTYDKVTRYSTADFTDGDAAYNANTIYICTDTGSIYKGATLLNIPRSGGNMTGSLNIKYSATSDDCGQIHISHPYMTKGTNPSTTAKYFTVDFHDKTHNIADYLKSRLGILETEIATNGKVTTRISAYKNEVDANVAATMSVSVAADGTKSCTFPDTDRCDGQWVNSHQTIISETSLTNSSNTDLNKTVTLPNDGCNYMVTLRATAVSGTSSGNYIRILVKSNVSTNLTYILSASTRTNSSMSNYGYAQIAMKYGSNNLTINRSSGYNGTATVEVIGYRRMGKNS